MSLQYKAVYKDKYGAENVIINNKARNVSLEIRGVEFLGHDFDDLEPNPNTNPDLLKSFDINEWNALDLFSLEYNAYVKICDKNSQYDGIIKVYINVGFEDKPMLKLTLTFNGNLLESTGHHHGFLDHELYDIYTELGKQTFIECCYYCNYSGSGSHVGMFGQIGCYRSNKQLFLQKKKIENEYKLFEIMTENVQPLYICPEFEIQSD